MKNQAIPIVRLRGTRVSLEIPKAILNQNLVFAIKPKRKDLTT